MEFYEAIKIIRKNKNISVEETIGNDLSKSTFYRYVNGQSDLASVNFINVLDNLKITLEEVQMFRNDKDFIEEKVVFKKIKEAFETREINKLKMIHTDCQEKYDLTHNIIFNHLVSLTNILIHRLEKKNIDIESTILFKYLINTETWGRYEIILFNNSLFYFNSNTVEQLLPRIMNRLSWYTNLNPYVNETIRLLSNVIILFLREKKLLNAFYYIETLEKMYVNEDQTFEKILIGIFSKLKEDFMNNDYNFTNTKNFMGILKILNMPNFYDMTVSLLDDLKTEVN